MELNIAIICHHDTISGAETAIIDLINGFTNRTSKRIINFHCICPEGVFADRLRSMSVDVKTTRVPSELKTNQQLKNIQNLFTLFWTWILIYIWCKKWNINLVQVNSVKAYLRSFPAIFLLDARLVYWCHDFPFSNIQTRILLKHANAIIADSIYTENKIKTLIGKQQNNKIRTIYFGEDLSESKYEKALLSPVPHKYFSEFSYKYPKIGYIGQLVKWKGIHDLIKSLVYVREKYQDVHLFVVGTSLDNTELLLNELKEISGNLGLLDQISFCGFVDNIWPVYRELDLVVMPSLEEPWGRVAAEAISIGCPVVVSSLSGISEVLDGAPGVCFVYPGNPKALAQTMLLNLLTISQYGRDSLRMQIRNWAVSNLPSIDQFCKNMYLMYCEVMGS